MCLQTETISRFLVEYVSTTCAETLQSDDETSLFARYELMWNIRRRNE